MWQIEVMWRATPWAPYGLVAALLVAVLAARPLARRGQTSTVGAGLWLALMGVIVTLTLTPGLSPMVHRQCGLVVTGPPSPAELLSLRERALNVWMYVPVALLAVLPRQRRTRVTALAAAAALPIVAEVAQWAIPALGRQCQLPDLVENLAGVAMGAAVGLAVHRFAGLAAPWRRGGVAEIRTGE